MALLEDPCLKTYVIDHEDNISLMYIDYFDDYEGDLNADGLPEGYGICDYEGECNSGGLPHGLGRCQKSSGVRFECVCVRARLCVCVKCACHNV